MIAVVPFVAVLYRLLTLLPQYAGLGDTITDFIFATFLPVASEVVLQKVREFSTRANELTLVGICVVFITTMLMMMRIEKSFNRIWHVPNTRSGLQRFKAYWVIVSFGVPLIGAAVIAASYDFSIELVSEFKSSYLTDFVITILTFVVTTATFTLLYFAVPCCRVRFIHALLGGLITSILIVLGKAIFASLVPLLQHVMIYGAFAALPLFVSGLFLAWISILIGAICARTFSLIAWEGETDGVPLVIKCVKVLLLLHKAHLGGTSLSGVDIVREVPMTRTENEHIFEVLRDGGWLQANNSQSWLLGRSLESVTLWELFLRLPDGISEAKLSADDEIEKRFMAFLTDGAAHLDVTLDRVVTNHALHPTDEI